MAEITRRRSGELLRGVFQILLDEPEGLPAKEVLQRLESLVPPTDYERAHYAKTPTARRFEKIVRFSTIGPVKAGWLVKNKGYWSLTDEGKRAYGRFTDPEQFRREADRLYRVWKADQPEPDVEENEDTAEETATTIEEAEEAAWAQIEDFFRDISPYDFQDLVAGLLRGMGYFVEWVSPPGPDKGIDVVAHLDPLGVKGPRIKAQVKRHPDRKISVDGVRSFVAVLSGSDVGIFVSTGGFTKDAYEEARRLESRRIMLIDLKRLFDLWVEHYDRIPDEQRRLLPLRPVYYLAPDDDDR